MLIIYLMINKFFHITHNNKNIYDSINIFTTKCVSVSLSNDL